MEKQQILSVVVPIYNASQRIAVCVRSIMKINLQDMEIILVDDGSTDDSLLICNEMKILDSRIKVYSKENGGVSSARNFGINKANGKYIFFIDCDDYIDGGKVSVLLKKAKEDSDVLFFGYIRENQMSKGVMEEVEVTEAISKNDLIRKMEDNSYLNSFGFVWNKIYRLDIIKQNNIFFEENLSLREDLMFNLVFLNKVNRIVESNLCIYHYIQYESSLSKQKVGKEAIQQLSRYFEEELRDNCLCLPKIKNRIMTSVLADYIIVDIFSSNSKYKNIKKDFKEILKYDKYVIDCEPHNLYLKILQRAFKKRNLLLLFLYYKGSLVKNKIKRESR